MAFLISALSEVSLFFCGVNSDSITHELVNSSPSSLYTSCLYHPVHFLPISPLGLKGTVMRQFILPLNGHTTLGGTPQVSGSF